MDTARLLEVHDPSSSSTRAVIFISFHFILTVHSLDSFLFFDSKYGNTLTPRTHVHVFAANIDRFDRLKNVIDRGGVRICGV